MAFTTSNIRKSAWGDLKVTAGDWAETVAGNTDATFKVEGGRIYHAVFDSQDSANGPVQTSPYQVSLSGSVSTITVANRNVVVNGRFLVIHA
jgi:hypothetical protein